MMSKNEIIAKYVKSIGQTSISGVGVVQSNQIPTTKQTRQQSTGGFNSSQYNNFMKQAVN
jgi:hypothetical protein